LTCHIPSCGVPVLQSALPEAMARADKYDSFITDLGNTEQFTSVGAGPGIGTDPHTQDAIHKLLSDCWKPVVLDADALNILSMNKEWLALLPEGAVLTPHLKEFERLAGKCENGFERMNQQSEFSREHKCIVVLKGANTSISMPDGRVMFNSTGNPGMATAGSGDVLTGMILSLLAQGYSSENAAVTGVFLHGLAGDIALEGSCQESIIASDIIKNIGNAFNRIRNRPA
jgi:ADP-dependent NAD(P)H-hydrate dehydratase / NAD(P)H-hydrate epimerase